MAACGSSCGVFEDPVENTNLSRDRGFLARILLRDHLNTKTER